MPWPADLAPGSTSPCSQLVARSKSRFLKLNHQQIQVQYQKLKCNLSKVPKYNSPKELYGEAVMEEMITGNVDPENLDTDMMTMMLIVDGDNDDHDDIR